MEFVRDCLPALIPAQVESGIGQPESDCLCFPLLRVNYTATFCR